MTTEKLWTGGAPPGDRENSEDLQNLLTKRQRDVLYALRRGGRLSQGELAGQIHAKPTALSNLLLKLDRFTPKLIQRDYEGKYCFYTLTEFGHQLIEQETEPTRPPATSLLQDRGDEVLFQTALESLRKLKQIGDPAKRFDDVLVVYVRGATVMPDPQSRRLVVQYLRSLELLSLHQNEVMFNQTLELLTERLDKLRVEEFMDYYFEPFSPVLRTLQEQGQELQISSILRSVFTDRVNETTRNLVQAVGWSSEELQELEAAAVRIKACLKNCSLEEIYDYFTALLPDQELLSASLSQWLSD